MACCFVPNCRNGRRRKKDDEKRHFFTAPVPVAARWIELMRVRSDKGFDPTDKNHRLCHLHFKEEDLVKFYEHVINGKKHYISRDRWSIRSNAIPTLFPDLPLSLKPSSQVIRRKLIRKPTEDPHPVRRKKAKLIQDVILQPPPVEEPPQQQIAVSIIENWWDEEKINYPTWLFHTTDERTFCSFLNVSYSTGLPSISKSIVLDLHGTPKMDVFVFSTKVNDYLTSCQEVRCTEDLRMVLAELSQKNICKGIAGFSSIKSSKSGVKNREVWKALNCEILGHGEKCTNCRILTKSLQRRLRNLRKTELAAKEKQQKQRKALSYLKSRSRALSSKMKIAKREVLTVKKKFSSLGMSDIQAIIDRSKLPKAMVEGVAHAIKSISVRSSKGMRYTTDWLLECLLLRIKSPVAYKYLREARILQLPSISTIRRIIAKQKCSYGFNNVAMNAIQSFFKDKPRRDRQGILMYDEIQLRETLDYNATQHRFDGFLDYGQYTYDLVKPGDLNKFADHALVLMYRPLNSNWVQPIAAFATKGAASGTVLNKIVLDAVIKLEGIGAEVLALVSDGAKPNKSFWGMCGVGEVNGEVVNKILHPWDDSRFLYFTCDPPHLFKCIRNHFLKYQVVEFLGNQIDFAFYEHLLKEDSQRSCGLRKCYKLTKSHVNPNAFEKMSVKLATQLFSRSVATGLQFYREMNLEEFKNSETTQDFTSVMNSLFDALNARIPSQGLRPGSVNYLTLLNFLGQLEVDGLPCKSRRINDVRFCSRETLLALRITIKSTIEMVNYLANELNYSYVLTWKINQDSLERFFGFVRAAGGREDHPTVTNFMQLSLHNPVNRIIKGNVENDAGMRLLVSTCDSFNGGRDTGLEDDLCDDTLKRVFDELRQRSSIAISSSSSSVKYSAASSYSSQILDRNIVYHLAGYLCFKSNKNVKCVQCLNCICSDEPQVSDAISKMTDILNYGGLCHPTSSFFNLILNVEKGVCSVLNSGILTGNVLVRCLESISFDQNVQIACSEPGHEECMLNLIPYYITMRLHFYSRSVRNMLGHGKATKSKRKESKLCSK